MILLQKAKKLAIEELKKRHDARHYLSAFTIYTKPDYRAGLHLNLLCKKLEAVERGEVKRLMVFMPPRHGKSELISKRFPAWFLGRNPTKQVITASYSAKLADKFGRDVRNLVTSKYYRNIFSDVALSIDSKAKDLWETNHGGVFLTAGIGGSMTGYGGHLAIIDDPVKDRHEAESQIMRDNVWDWYKSVLRTRIMPGGAIIIVQTRWHVDDLSGRLLSQMKNDTGEKWEVINLPAIANENDVLGRKKGEPLWPEAYDRNELEQIRKAVGERDWYALYQGEPTLSTGSIFKVNMLNIIDAAPKPVQVVRRWDFAASRDIGKYDPDWTVGVKMQRNVDSGYTVLDVVRLRGLPDEVIKTVKAVASQDGFDVKIVIPQDPGQAGVAQVQYYLKMLAGYKIKAIRETGNKIARADPFASQVNIGNVSLLRANWNRSYLDELSDFPNGSHDDQVDASSGAFEAISLQRKLPKMPNWQGIMNI
ncbi:phage terminase large subunit [Commensalibacter melissae]|uniref:phage terminase large subunit n=1 Tax=Commensalibacter melissae TaxID=2070537 RepID=UPI000EFCD14F|nr:phage terminase large subunit [Commensalibacter melissae]AYN86401.1 terminase [Commensalibacter melissae]